MIKDYIQVIVLLGAVVSLSLGAYTYFAKAEDLKFVEYRLDQKIISDQIYRTQERIWILEDRNAGPPDKWQDKRDKEQHRLLMRQLEELRRREKR